MATTENTHWEHRWPVLLITVGALGLYLLLPDTISGIPNWIVPAIGVVVLVPLVLQNPRRLSTESKWSRLIGIGLAFALAAVNQIYIVRIVFELVDGRADGPIILLTALKVWLANVIVFALMYWQLDKGGPVRRRIEGNADKARQDFRFPQQDNPDNVGPWHAEFLDYAYFSLTNMMAFSPTDVMPLSRRAKALMGFQALTGFILLALVISRAVNILTA
ncbi:MAG: DUF1345 domain-containing protein [Rhodoglobus sp.]